MLKKLFLVRHASYEGEGGVLNPELSAYGKHESVILAKTIQKHLMSPEMPIIWSSTAKRAFQTATIIQKQFEIVVPALTPFEKLWSDNFHPYDLQWLKDQLNVFEGNVLIVVSHLEYVRYFPRMLGFPSNFANYAEGVYIDITTNTCINI